MARPGRLLLAALAAAGLGAAPAAAWPWDPAPAPAPAPEQAPSQEHTEKKQAPKKEEPKKEEPKKEEPKKEAAKKAPKKEEPKEELKLTDTLTRKATAPPEDTRTAEADEAKPKEEKDGEEEARGDEPEAKGDEPEAKEEAKAEGKDEAKSEPAPGPKPEPTVSPKKQKYLEARSAAEAVVGQLEDMLDSLTKKTKGDADQKLSPSEQAAFDKERHNMTVQEAAFDKAIAAAKAAAEAAAAAQGANASAAAAAHGRHALDAAEKANEELHSFAGRAVRALDREVHREDNDMRGFSRRMEEQSEKLARVARKKTDSLDNAARESGEPNVADKLNRRAEGAVDKIRGAAENFARREAERAERAPEYLEDKLAGEAKKRREELSAARASLRKAEAKSRGAAVEEQLAAAVVPAAAGSALLGFVCGGVFVAVAGLRLARPGAPAVAGGSSALHAALLA